MSGAQSISTRRAYGVQRVCRVWHRARSSVYARRQATRSPAPCRRRGPIGAAPDDVLVAHIRRGLEASPFHGEGYRKAWAKLRVDGIRTSQERVRRLMRESGLQAPPRVGHAHGPKAHDGTITTEAPDVMWGTDMTATVTVAEGAAFVFVAVDHCATACIGLHAAKRGNRFEALEPIRQGIRERFGGIGAPRNADCYNPAAFQANRRFWGDVCITAACAASPNPYGTDGYGIAQNWEIGPTSRSSFSRVTDRPDADLNRLYELAFTAGIEHEIRPGVSARFQWFRRSSHNQEFSDNRLRSFADYTPFQWVAPSGEVITSFSLNPAAAALDDTVDGNAVSRTRVYNGLDVSVSARLPGGGQLLAGWTMEKERQQNCDEIDDPNLMRFCDERSAGLGPPSEAGTVPGFDGNFLTGLAEGLGTEFPVPWRHEFKLVGSYPLPGGFQVQAALQSYPGIGVPQWFLLTRGTTYSEVNGYSQHSCAPPCVFNAPINRMLVPPSLIVPLAPLPGQLASTPSGSNKFLPRWTLLDAGVTKRFDISGLLVDVKAEVFNLLNADFYLSTRSPFVNTPVYDVPVSITQARLLRLASTIRW